MKEKLLAKRAEYQTEYSDLVKELEYLKVKIEVVNEMISDLEEDEEPTSPSVVTLY